MRWSRNRSWRIGAAALSASLHLLQRVDDRLDQDRCFAGLGSVPADRKQLHKHFASDAVSDSRGCRQAEIAKRSLSRGEGGSTMPT